jgi:hypothetical protein
MITNIVSSFSKFFNRDAWRWKIWVAKPEVNHVDAGTARLSL